MQDSSRSFDADNLDRDMREIWGFDCKVKEDAREEVGHRSDSSASKIVEIDEHILRIRYRPEEVVRFDAYFTGSEKGMYKANASNFCANVLGFMACLKRPEKRVTEVLKVEDLHLLANCDIYKHPDVPLTDNTSVVLNRLYLTIAAKEKNPQRLTTLCASERFGSCAPYVISCLSTSL